MLSFLKCILWIAVGESMEPTDFFQRHFLLWTLWMFVIDGAVVLYISKVWPRRLHRWGNVIRQVIFFGGKVSFPFTTTNTNFYWTFAPAFRRPAEIDQNLGSPISSLSDQDSVLSGTDVDPSGGKVATESKKARGIDCIDLNDWNDD